MVCDMCAKKHAPEMVRIRGDAGQWNDREVYAVKQSAADEILHIIDEPVIERVRQAVMVLAGDDFDLKL